MWCLSVELVAFDFLWYAGFSLPFLGVSILMASTLSWYESHLIDLTAWLSPGLMRPLKYFSLQCCSLTVPDNTLYILDLPCSHSAIAGSRPKPSKLVDTWPSALTCTVFPFSINKKRGHTTTQPIVAFLLHCSCPNLSFPFRLWSHLRAITTLPAR